MTQTHTTNSESDHLTTTMVPAVTAALASLDENTLRQLSQMFADSYKINSSNDSNSGSESSFVNVEDPGHDVESLNINDIYDFEEKNLDAGKNQNLKAVNVDSHSGCNSNGYSGQSFQKQINMDDLLKLGSVLVSNKNNNVNIDGNATITNETQPQLVSNNINQLELLQKLLRSSQTGLSNGSFGSNLDLNLSPTSVLNLLTIFIVWLLREITKKESVLISQVARVVKREVDRFSKNVERELGRGSKNLGKEIEKGSKNVVKEVERSSKVVIKEVERSTKSAVKEIERGWGKVKKLF